MDFIRENWGIIMGALCFAVWMGKLQRDVQALQKETFVTNDRCGERRMEINKLNDVEFKYGAERLLEIKRLLEQQNEVVKEQNKAVLMLNSENDRRLDMVNQLAEERFNRLIALLKHSEK